MEPNLETTTEESPETDPQPPAPSGVFVQISRDDNGEPTVNGISPVGDAKISETQFILERGVVLYRAQVGL